MERFEDLAAYMELQYRAARRHLAHEFIKEGVFGAFANARREHHDFDEHEFDLKIMSRVISIDCSIVEPAEYLETLYAVVKHAGYVVAARLSRRATVEGQNVDSSAGGVPIQ